MIRDDNDARIDRIRVAVEKLHGCKANHDTTAVVVEKFRGETVWAGVVEIFNLFGASKETSPPAKRCFAWEIPGPKPDWVAVLDKPPVSSPETAVRAYVASLGRK